MINSDKGRNYCIRKKEDLILLIFPISDPANLLPSLQYAYNNLLKLPRMRETFADLSCNQLSGRIPETFVDLDFLGYLNLSNNNLSGRIPILPHLQTFEESSFSGNLKLCGEPVQRKCNYRTSNSGQ